MHPWKSGSCDSWCIGDGHGIKYGDYLSSFPQKTGFWSGLRYANACIQAAELSLP